MYVAPLIPVGYFVRNDINCFFQEMCAVIKAAKYYIMGKYKLRYTINYNLLSPDFKQILETDVKNLLELSFGKS